MTTYAIIDLYSGFIWGVQEASDPIEACRLMDQEIGGEPREYDEGVSGDTGYVVYEAPDGFAVDDGQDEDTIAAVSALPEVARVSWSDAQ